MLEEEDYTKIDEMMKSLPDNVLIIEEHIDVEIQKEYFDLSNLIREQDKSPTADDVIELIKIIKKSKSKKKVRYALSIIAQVDSIEAYRTIEEFTKKPIPELKEWAILALQESRMLIQCSLLGEQQVYISTGLGGKNDKLRFLIIFPYDEKTNMSKSRIDFFKSELLFALKQFNSDLEEIEFHETYLTSLILVPLKISVAEIINNLINECSQCGLHFKNDIIITNTKKFTPEEISELLQRNGK